MIETISIKLMVAIFAALLTWMGYMQKTLSDMKKEIEEKVVLRNQLHQKVQDMQSDDIARLEKKIDFIIEQMLKNN